MVAPGAGEAWPTLGASAGSCYHLGAMGLWTRRQFLGRAAAGAAALAAAPAWAAGRERFQGPYGVQMYSIRAGMAQDPAAALAMVRGIGYTEIEAWQPQGVNARRIGPLLRAAGLKATGMHTTYAALNTRMGELADNAHILGCRWVTCAWVDEGLRRNADDYRRLAEHFNQFGEKLQAAGLRLGYHNHTVEFVHFGGRTGYDILLARTDPKLMWFELDIGHARRAGASPLELLRRHPRRILLLHLKDVAPKPGVRHPRDENDYQDVPMGTGVIDLPAVLRQAALNRVERYYVEEEVGDPRQRLTLDYQYLRRVRF